MAFIKTVSKNAIGAVAGIMPESRRSSIYKKDGLMKLNIIECVDGDVIRTTYMDVSKRIENQTFWTSPEGVTLSEKLKDVLTVIVREKAETLPDLSGYYFFNLAYTLAPDVPSIVSLMTDIEGVVIVEHWDTDTFKLGCNKEKKDAVAKILNTLKVKFTV